MKWIAKATPLLGSPSGKMGGETPGLYPFLNFSNIFKRPSPDCPGAIRLVGLYGGSPSIHRPPSDVRTQLNGLLKYVVCHRSKPSSLTRYSRLISISTEMTSLGGTRIPHETLALSAGPISFGSHIPNLTFVSVASSMVFIWMTMHVVLAAPWPKIMLLFVMENGSENGEPGSLPAGRTSG